MAEIQPPILVLGTGNRKKLAELTALLGSCPLQLKALSDFPQAITVEETGVSFAANAALKAIEQARHLNAWVLGEDSGLAVDALGGQPGIFSARYSDPDASDEKNNQKLLAELKNVPPEKRTAHYVCHATLADPQGNIRAEAVGFCQGRLRQDYAGSGGFGYDPLFEIVEYHRTFGELAPAVKKIISHRSRAIRQLVPVFTRLVHSGIWKV